MGEIFNALEVLNRTMKLGLSGSELLRAEMGFKSALARQGNPDPTAALPEDPVALAEGYELVATLRRREEPVSLERLSTLARREMTRPRTRVDVKTMKQIDRALAATPQKAPRGATATAGAVTKATGGAAAGSAGAATKARTPAAKRAGAAKKTPRGKG